MDRLDLDRGAARTASELRVQLAQMTAASQMLERMAADEKSRRYLAAMNQGICRMLRVVGRLELTQRLSEEHVELKPVLTNLVRVAEDLGEKMGKLLAYAGVELKVRAPELLLSMVEEDLIRQMLMELAANAAKAGTHVRLTLTQDGNRAVFTVEDDGPGIPPERLAYFFHSEEEALPDWRRGGMGIAIARRVAALHGGTLAAVCAEGRGLHVVASIPLGEGGENLLRQPGVRWDQGGFGEELVALSHLLPADAFTPGIGP